MGTTNQNKGKQTGAQNHILLIGIQIDVIKNVKQWSKNLISCVYLCSYHIVEKK